MISYVLGCGYAISAAQIITKDYRSNNSHISVSRTDIYEPTSVAHANGNVKINGWVWQYFVIWMCYRSVCNRDC